MRAVIAEAAARKVAIHRVSQGSGIMLQTDAEIRDMLALGREHKIEVCLFVGPRANWDTGVQASTLGGRVLGSSLRGADQLAYGVEDVLHGAALGLRSILVADLGHLKVLGEMKRQGDLPADFVLKVSVTLAAANPATARLLEDLGATSINLPVDLPLAHIAAIRQAIDAPIDFYVEAPDDFGGTVRHYETAALVRVAAPIYLKYGLRNSPGPVSERPASGGTGGGAFARAGAPRRHRPGASSPPLPGGRRVAMRITKDSTQRLSALPGVSSSSSSSKPTRVWWAQAKSAWSAAPARSRRAWPSWRRVT